MLKVKIAVGHKNIAQVSAFKSQKEKKIHLKNCQRYLKIEIWATVKVTGMKAGLKNCG